MTEYSDAGRTTTAKIDLSNPGKLIGMLSAPYNDPVLAVVREYLANAVDSHVASGQSRPVEVSLPSHQDPRFRVRDYGSGLTWDQVSDLYFNYSASTKEQTDEEIGNLGLGSKAAFAVSETWRITTTAQAQTWVVEVMRDPSGVPKPRVVYHGPAGDRDEGIEVSVDVNLRDYPDASWISALKKLALWLPAGSFTVVGLIGSDGDFPSAADDTLVQQLTDSLYSLSGVVDSELSVIMCGIPYLVTKPMAAAIRDRVRAEVSDPDLLVLRRFGYGYRPVGRLQRTDSSRIIEYGGVAVVVPPGAVSINLQRETVPATAANLDAVATAMVTELQRLAKRLRRVNRQGTTLLDTLVEWAAVLPEGGVEVSITELLRARPEWNTPINSVWFCAMDTTEATTLAEVVNTLAGFVYRSDRRHGGYHDRIVVVTENGAEPDRLDYFLRYYHRIIPRGADHNPTRGYRTPVVWSGGLPKEVLPLLHALADPNPGADVERLRAVLGRTGFGTPCEIALLRRSEVVRIAEKAYQRFRKASASAAYRLAVLTSVGGVRTADGEATPGRVKKFIADHGATVYAVRGDYNLQIPAVVTRPVVVVFVASADSIIRTDRWGRELPLREIKTKTLAKSLGVAESAVRTQDGWEDDCADAIVSDARHRAESGEAALDDIRDFLTLAVDGGAHSGVDRSVRAAMAAVAAVLESPHGYLVPDDHPARIAYLALTRGGAVWREAASGGSGYARIAAARLLTDGYDHTRRSGAWTGSALLLGAGIPGGLGGAEETLEHAARYLASTGGSNVG